MNKIQMIYVAEKKNFFQTTVLKFLILGGLWGKAI
jgi:hypothetical protein